MGGAHPFENPTGFTSVFDLLLVIVLPFAIVFMFGRLIGKPRQVLAIVAVMAVIFLGRGLIYFPMLILGPVGECIVG